MRPFAGVPLPRRLGWILGAHFLLLLAIFSLQGILVDKEALKYTGCARDVLAGDFEDVLHRYRLYASYVLFLVPFTALGMPQLAVPAQVALGILAAFSLRHMVLLLGGSSTRADIAFAVLLLAYPLQIWTLALYSESFFVSLSVIFFAEALRSGVPRGRMFAWAALLVFARPVGILFVAPVLAWRLLDGNEGIRIPAIWTVGTAVLAVVSFLPVIGHEQLLVVIEGHVIGGFPQWPGTGNSFHGNTLAGAELEVVRQQGLAAWAWLVLQRIGWFFGAWRPYFSTLHNALNAPLALLYPMAALTVVRRWNIPFVQVSAVILLLNTVLVGLTFAEWNGRFLVPLVPLVILLAVVPNEPLRSVPVRKSAEGHSSGQQQQQS